ncbi:MAG TPA: hypothetical protein VE961_17075 [Pyrinomonadaceae bacterium]|nr:hypothetical protein [Pyrinomonadaceae bacterium]
MAQHSAISVTGNKLLFALLLFTIASNGATAQRPENDAREREEYAVYSAIVADHTPVDGGTIIIANPTSLNRKPPRMNDLEFSPGTPALSAETYEDFVIRNHTNRWLTPNFQMKRKYEVVDYREIVRLTDMGQRNTAAGGLMEEWKDFFKVYPSSRVFVSLSRVGFNEQMDQALVHFGWRCPGLCGQWCYYLLAKKDGVWKVVGEANCVVS